MTRISTKLTAMLIATVTIGGAVISSTNSASAMQRGERMGMSRMNHSYGHGHHGRHGGGGFGRGMAIGAGIGIVGALAHAAAQQTYAESVYPDGTRIRSEGRGKGVRVVTKREPNGKVVREVKKPQRASASATDTNTGETTSVQDNGNGTRTITKTDAKGNRQARVENNKQPSSASSTNPETGETTTSISNGNGTRTVVRTDGQGKVLSSEVVR